MKLRVLALALMIALAAVSGCVSDQTDTDVDEPGSEAPSDDGASGLRLANGLYDLEDGRVQAIGTLEWIDLEGGFYAVTGRPEGEGEGNIAVIANAAGFEDELERLEGKTVSIIGRRVEGASIRMAGPEIEIETIEEISDTPGIAE